MTHTQKKQTIENILKIVSMIGFILMFGIFVYTVYHNTIEDRELSSAKSTFCISHNGTYENSTDYCYYIIGDVAYQFDIKNISGEFKFVEARK